PTRRSSDLLSIVRQSHSMPQQRIRVSPRIPLWTCIWSMGLSEISSLSRYITLVRIGVMEHCTVTSLLRFTIIPIVPCTQIAFILADYEGNRHHQIRLIISKRTANWIGQNPWV